MNLNNLKILLVLHKNSPFIEHPFLFPIQVNCKNSKERLNMQGDDEGENISEKNDRYSELTAMYWAWKNLTKTDYIGLFHYRRYLLSEKGLVNKIKDYLVFFLKRMNMAFFKKELETNIQRISIFSDINEIKSKLEYTFDNLQLSKNTIYVSSKVIFKYLSVKEQYIFSHIKEDWNILEEVVLKLSPDYAASLETVSKRKDFYPFNIFIMNFDVYNEYCQWLFSILFEVEKRIELNNYPYQKRVFGFMAERLLNVFIEKKRISEGFNIKQLKSSFINF